MTQEKIQQATENFNALSAEQKQAVWSKAIEELSKVDLKSIEGGGAVSDYVNKWFEEHHFDAKVNWSI